MKPEEGYELYGAYVWWHENGSYTEDDILPSADGTYSFTMPNADVTVTAIFHNPGAVYKISASSNAGGTVAVSTTEAKAGDSIAVTMEASDGYAISGFEITGAWIGRSGGSSDEKTLVHTFTMPPCDVVVSVTFAGEGTGGEDPQIPGAVYYLYSEEKTEFSRNTNTYTTWYRQADDNGYPVLDDDGHYAYYAGAEGTYSYTDTGVTLTPERGFFNTELFDFKTLL